MRWPATSTNLMNAALMQVDIVRLSPSSTLGDAVRQLSRWQQRYAVVEQDEQFVGLVCDRDLRLALPSRLPHAEDGAGCVLETTIMSVCLRRPYTAHPNGSAVLSAQFMLHKRLGCLPIVEPDSGRAVGLLTLSDFARVFAAFGMSGAPPALSVGS